MTKRQKAKIEEALNKEFRCAIEWHDKKNYGNVRYYGGFGEYAVIFIDTLSGPSVPYTLKIGRWSFYHPPGIFHLLMYKDGTFIHLKDAYEQGIVDDDMIAIVKERHLNAENWD